MSVSILSGIIARDTKTPMLAKKVSALSSVPTISIIQVGDRTDSTAYINAKKAFAKKTGVSVSHIHFLETVAQNEVINAIRRCNEDGTIAGIIIQLPLPRHLDQVKIIDSIDPKKDVDGLTETNQQKLRNGDYSGIVPGTARGVKELLEYYSIDLKGKKVAVVGRSRLVGTPIALLAKQAGADVIVCHSKTVNLSHETSQADILIVAVGKPGLIGAQHVKRGAVVIDVGISKLPDGHIKGDVDFGAVKDIASAITPVPGGVGPMTVLGLFENVIDVASHM